MDRGTAGFVRRLLGQTHDVCDARDRCDDQEEQAELNDAASSHRPYGVNRIKPYGVAESQLG